MQTGLEYGPPSVEKTLGALLVVREILNRIGLAETVNELCPVRDLARITNGQVIEALVANRLTSPAPLLHIEDWARQWAVEEIFGIPADALNDDRIGRALDAFAEQPEAVAGSVATRAITAFGIDVSRIHWDMNAPRGALLYSQHSWEELGGRFLGLMAYLYPKGNGEP